MNQPKINNGGMSMRNETVEYYKNLDTTNAKLVQPAIIKKLRERQREVAYSALDMDVLTWLSTQDVDTKKHINEVIRHFMAVKTN